ncbi:MAG: AEC family transporter [Deltaproteobacteria bacterium]|nr:AEC family transporter [Deltaproteobacteria bacterium]
MLNLLPILDNVLPVFALMGLGRWLLRRGILGPEFYATSDRLVYYIFFPALLFLKISTASISWGEAAPLFAAVLSAIFLVWAGSLLYIRWAGLSAFQAGTFSQVTYRFNTYVGMAVVGSALGSRGLALFGVLISLAIPFINLLAVGTLVWFSEASFSPRQKAALLAKALFQNPLILGCLAGLLYARLGWPLPKFAANLLGLMSALTLPLALLSIGGGLTVAGLQGRLKPALAAAGFKLVLLPLVGGTLLWLLGGRGPDFKLALMFLALPTATSAYILSRQMGSDAGLAAASIVASTLLSFFSLSAVLALV